MFAGDNGQGVVQNLLTVACFVCLCVCARARVCVFPECRAGFAAAEDDEWSPALELDGVGKMDLPNGRSSITTTAATVSEVRPCPLARPSPTHFTRSPLHASPSTFHH